MSRVTLLSAMAVVLTLSLARIGAGQQGIPWTDDFRAAQQTAARERKLILLHFYSDNCRPCKTLERNVFSQRAVAAAMATNYIPVKVHVDSMPQLAQRYQVEAWPTDVIVSSAGLEVFRTISPQSPAQYQTMLDQVAFQAGVGAGRLAGSNKLDTSDRAGDVSLVGATAPADPAGEQTAGANTLPPTNPPGSRYDRGSAGSFNQAAATDPRFGAQPSVSRQPPTGAVPSDGAPYVGGSQYSPPADRWGQPAANHAAATTAPQSVYATAPQSPAAQRAANLPPPQRSAPAEAILEPTHSIYDSPAPHSAPSTPQSQPAVQPGYQSTPQAAYQPRIGQPQHQPPQRQAAQQPAPQPSMAQQTSAQFRSRQFVDASQAPPFAIEQFCPVTLLESRKWQKGNVRFGAVHRNRTYLFASEEAQRRFLANPERYVPVLSGCDPVIFAETNQWIDGNPSIGLLIGGKTFFFVSAESRARFEISPQPYMARAYQGMAEARSR